MLPGVGADARLFEPQAAGFPNLVVPRWIEPEAGESLEAYGERMAATIDVERPFYLGGASFGGMAALEVARHTGPEAVFLLGSCRSRLSVPVYMRFLERVSRLAPSWALDISRGVVPRLAGVVEPLDEHSAELFAGMLADTSIEFVRWATQAIVGWSFEAELACPIYHIHGALDAVLPLRLVEPDQIVPDGSHLITLTHGDVVNAFMAERMTA
ncbi:alpha/beta hydrolase [bacterium]|nr:alpha/beta hydrolase [bacterium]